MTPYYLLIGLPILIYFIKIYISKEEKDINSKQVITLFFVLLFFILALRSDNIGIDLSNYKIIFSDNYSKPFSTLWAAEDEKGYLLLNKAVSLFTTNFQWLLVIIALITIIPVAIVYIKQVEMPLLTILLYVNMSTFVMLFSGLRQSIAIGIGLLAYLAVKKKKLIIFILLVLLAMTFHQSAFILFVMYPLYYMKIKGKSFFFLMPIALITFVFRLQIYKLAIKLLPERYSIYEISSTGAYTVLLLLVIFVIYSYFIPDKTKLDENTNGLRNFLLLATFIQMFVSLSPMAMRMNYYFIIFIPLLIPQIIKRSYKQWDIMLPISQLIITEFFFFYFFYNAYFGEDILRVFPYEFFWR